MSLAITLLEDGELIEDVGQLVAAEVVHVLGHDGIDLRSSLRPLAHVSMSLARDGSPIRHRLTPPMCAH